MRARQSFHLKKFTWALICKYLPLKENGFFQCAKFWNWIPKKIWDNIASLHFVLNHSTLPHNPYAPPPPPISLLPGPPTFSWLLCLPFIFGHLWPSHHFLSISQCVLFLGVPQTSQPMVASPNQTIGACYGTIGGCNAMCCGRR